MPFYLKKSISFINFPVCLAFLKLVSVIIFVVYNMMSVHLNDKKKLLYIFLLGYSHKF